MTRRRLLFSVLGLAVALFFITACSQLLTRPSLMTATPDEKLTPSEQIAGEIMAYLVEVVLGRAGAIEKRTEWATRGQSLALDFGMVTRRMFGPVPLRAELMVLDTNILGLSRVLYHFDKRLNLFKGMREQESLYPCAELIAIRLFLLQKLRRNEKVSMAGLNRHIALFSPDSRDALGAELEAMKLSGTEFRFLKDIFTSEPAFFKYIRHPFIVATFRKIGVIEQDPFALSADLTATYNQLSCTPVNRKKERPVTVAIVPGLNPMVTQTLDNGGFTPTEAYLTLQEELEKSIVRKIGIGNNHPLETGRMNFFTPNRPVTIVPENADRVMSQLCPDADFTVVIMGKNVYRGLYINPDADILPHKNLIYLDVDDLRYQMVDEEIDTLANTIRAFLANNETQM